MKLYLSTFAPFLAKQMISGLVVIIAVAAASLISTRLHAETTVLAPGYRALNYPAPVPGNYILPPLGYAADGEILNTDGRAIRLHELFENRIVLLSFIYVSCDDVNGCSLATSVLLKVKRKLAEQFNLASVIRIVTLSFDPERDTPDAMKHFGKYFIGGSIDWKFVTASGDSDLLPILDSYGQTVSRMTGQKGNDSGRFSHILRVFLIDRNKQIRNIYSTSFLHPDTLISDIKTLQLEGREDLLSTVATGPSPRVTLVNKPPLGLPALPVPSKNPQTSAAINLGRKLFFDRRLSLNNTMSCAMCHIPEQGFTNNEMATAVGIEGRTVRRNAPTLYNVGYLSRLFHDGREYSLEQQVWGPLLATNEMANPSVGYVLEKLRLLGDYKGLFEAAFQSGLTMQTLGMALASYQRTLNSADSEFDRWYFAKDVDALSPQARAGFRLFTGKAACNSCHRITRQNALLTDNLLHNTGVGYKASMQPSAGTTRVRIAPGQFVQVDKHLITSVSEPRSSDLGQYEITQSPHDRWKYRTPSLRNIVLTAPYMHDGSMATLEEVVEFYDHGGFVNKNQDSRIRPLNLSGQEKDELLAFLRSLTGSNIKALVADALTSEIGDPGATQRVFK